MNNSNSSIQFNINPTYPLEFTHNNQPFSNPPSSLNTNINNASSRPESNLIRPIPHKVDLSRMFYQQFLDQYRRPIPGITEMKDVSENYYHSIQKMYHEALTNGTMPQSNAANGMGEFAHQIRNSNTPYNDPRILLNQYLSSNSTNRSGLLTNQFYNNSANLKATDLPHLSATDSYLLNNINQQVLLRQGQMDGVAYVSMNGSEEVPSVKNGIREEINTLSNVQYYPKTSISDKFIDNRFSMSINPHSMFNHKIRDTQILSSKVERTNKKPSKQQIKSTPIKTTKILKRNRQSKTIDNCDETLLQNNLRENILTTCATPSDSSISPVSMVSCRSTTTPQTLFPSLSNLVPNHHNNSNDKLDSNISEKVGTNSIESDKNSDFNRETCKKIKTDKNSIQGLPIKKRIKWQVERDDNDDTLLEISTSDNRTKTTEAEVEMRRATDPVIEVDDKKISTENSETCMFYLEDPLKTFQKTFLPMEKHSYSSDTESDNDLVIADYNNI